MADVMKQVVQDILGGNKTVISRQTSNVTENSESDSSLKQIKRPNYQALKKDQRLSFVEENTTSSTRNSNTGNEENKRHNNTSLHPKQFNEDSISKLTSLTLAQGNIPNRNIYSRENNSQNKMARIIGQTKNGGCVWFFPDLPKELIGSFKRPLNSASVGVIKMPECLPSYLLLINEIIRNNQDIKFYLSWSKEEGTPFTAELYDDNADRLGKIMNDIYQKINRRSLKQYETYTAVSPSSWLSKQLNLNSSIDAIAFLEGIPYYTGIVLMDSLLKNFERNDFDYEVNSNYLLLKGNYHVISKLVTEMKKEAARLVAQT